MPLYRVITKPIGSNYRDLEVAKSIAANKAERSPNTTFEVVQVIGETKTVKTEFVPTPESAVEDDDDDDDDDQDL